jgi:hypothetical protein
MSRAKRVTGHRAQEFVLELGNLDALPQNLVRAAIVAGVAVGHRFVALVHLESWSLPHHASRRPITFAV